MCRSKKSMSGQVERCSSSRISVTAVVENASGVTGPSIARSRTATTRRASSTEVMKGNNRRSKCRSGNWISRALPIVSALIPVLSDRKNTGTGAVPPSDISDPRSGRGCRPGSQLDVDALGVQVVVHVRRAALRAVPAQLGPVEPDHGVDEAVTVHPHRPRVDPVDHPKSGREVLRPHGPTQPVVAVVGDGD